ncbi:hypothetical protein C0J52_19835 [Blattella germanica]|nr:hypothetical protein C0J52_19835 [Blattella germanica]
MSKSPSIDDPTCIMKMMNDFLPSNTKRRCNLKESIPPPFAPTRLVFDDSMEETTARKRKHSDSHVKTSIDKLHDETMEIPASPWDVRRLKADFMQMKAQNANLEGQVQKLHALRKELEVIFESEKSSFLKRQECDRETIKMLEDRMKILRQREQEYKEQLAQSSKSVGIDKLTYEKKIFSLQKENSQLKDQIKEIQLSLHNKSTSGDLRIAELESELSLTSEEIIALKTNAKTLQEKAAEASIFKNQMELQNQHLLEANLKIKELEMELENGKEAKTVADKQLHNLKRIPELEQEVVSLKGEIVNLREAVRNKLILEEEVVDLRARQERLQERESQLAHLQATQQHLEAVLELWHKLARDHCIGVPPERAIIGPEMLRIRIEALQEKELTFTSDKAQLESRLVFLRMERDSYRSQLDMYEKELTITSSASLLNPLQQQQKSRIEALEKTVEGYRELVEKLEAEQAKSSKSSGGSQLVDKIQKLEEEKNALKQENEQLMRRRDELETELEYRALKGDFNPMKTKILHYRMNPASEAETKQKNEVMELQQECDRLRERLRLIQEGQTEDVTRQVNLHLATSSTQEIQELKEQLKTADLRNQRLKEVFKASSKEFRELVYMLLGYKIDLLKTSLYRLSSICSDDDAD